MSRTRFLSVTLVVVGVLTAGCVGSGKTPRAATIEPLPRDMRIAVDVSTGCREGESGFDYRFVVVGPADLDAGSDLLDSIRSKDFVRTGLYTDDLPWATTGYQNTVHPIRIEAATLDRYLQNPAPYTGPPVDQIPADIRADAAKWVLIAMRPTDFACTTPL